LREWEDEARSPRCNLHHGVLRPSNTTARKDFEANIFRLCFQSSGTFVATYRNGETPGGQTITS
jgi:hypothetical protein